MSSFNPGSFAHSSRIFFQSALLCHLWYRPKRMSSRFSSYHLDSCSARSLTFEARNDACIRGTCIRGTGNLIRFKPSYDYRGWSSGRLSMIIFSRNAFHTPLQLQYYSRKIQVHSYGTTLQLCKSLIINDN